jgi:hypothetical protein
LEGKGGSNQITSQLSVREFCRAEALAELAFYFWWRELAKRDAESLKKPVQHRHGTSVQVAGTPRREFLPVLLQDGKTGQVRYGQDAGIKVTNPVLQIRVDPLRAGVRRQDALLPHSYPGTSGCLGDLCRIRGRHQPSKAGSIQDS